MLSIKGNVGFPVKKLKERCGGHYESLVKKCNERFGKDWLTTRGTGDAQMLKLKTFEQISQKLNEPGRFLYMWGEEVNCEPTENKEKTLHMNYINLPKHMTPPPMKGEIGTVIEAATRQVEMAKLQSKEHGRPVLLQLNHPMWVRSDISAEDIAGIPGLDFLEVMNMGGDCNTIGNGKQPSCEKLWDIANTIRIEKLKQNPLYVTATDDCHNYLTDDPCRSQPGRGFVVVQSKKLDANLLIEAMQRGDFYASTGVMLKAISFDPASKTLRVEVEPEADTNFTIEFIGTRRGTSIEPTDTCPDGYSAKIGEIFKTVKGTSGEYIMTGDELYIRAAVRSDRKLYRAEPSPVEIQIQQALTQPFGWTPQNN